MPFLDEIDPVAEAVGAVNTISISRLREPAVLKGFNTDVEGFSRAVGLNSGSSYRKALILGTGGASKAVKYVLERICDDVLMVSRSGPGTGIISYSDVDVKLLAEYTLIVNTTPLGTWPEKDVCPPIPYEVLSNKHYLFDLVYNPAMTKFLESGRVRGARISNGQKMLEIQADASWNIWRTFS